MKAGLSFALILLCFISPILPAKNTFEDPSGGYGHADDISKLLTGRGYAEMSWDSQRLILLNGLAYIMHLVVDSRMKTNGEPYPEGEEAMQYLNTHAKELNINNIPNIREFITPGGNTHGVYSHLGWNHVYPETLGYYGETLYPNRTWQLRKKLLCDALGKMFNFSLFDGKKKDSLGALFYYLHILGDHAENTAGTAQTRIPIISKTEQGTLPWDNDVRWVPESTIQDELILHLSVLFSSQRNNHLYISMMNELQSFNMFTVPYVSGDSNEAFVITSSFNQQERARRMLQILFDFCPYLLSNESFAKGFYKKYGIQIN